MELPFNIGDVLWMPASAPRQITIPCPICAGQRYVTVVLGSGEEVRVDCDGCGLGFEGPRGTISEWEHNPKVERFEIAGVQSMHDNRWTVMSTSGATCEYAGLFQTEAKAMAETVKRAEQQIEHNMMSRAHRKKGLSKTAWTVRYHRERIKDAERDLAWHRKRLHQKDRA